MTDGECASVLSAQVRLAGGTWAAGNNGAAYDVLAVASLQQESTGKFQIVIFHSDKRFKRSLDTKKKSLALARKHEIEETLTLVKRGRLTVPT